VQVVLTNYVFILCVVGLHVNTLKKTQVYFEDSNCITDLFYRYYKFHIRIDCLMIFKNMQRLFIVNNV